MAAEAYFITPFKFKPMTTTHINYREQLEILINQVCNEISKELQRIGKEEIRKQDGFDEFRSTNDEDKTIIGINKEGYVLIESYGGDDFALSISSEDWNVHDLIWILEQLQSMN